MWLRDWRASVGMWVRKMPWHPVFNRNLNSSVGPAEVRPSGLLNSSRHLDSRTPSGCGRVTPPESLTHVMGLTGQQHQGSAQLSRHVPRPDRCEVAMTAEQPVPTPSPLGPLARY